MSQLTSHLKLVCLYRASTGTNAGRLTKPVVAGPVAANVLLVLVVVSLFTAIVIITANTPGVRP